MKRHLLSDAEVRSYRKNGYVTPQYRLPTGALADLRATVEALIDSNADVRPEQLVGAHIKNSKDTGVRGRGELLDFAQHPDLLDIAEQIIGPDLILWGSQVFSKPARDGMAIPWHQDGQYWPMRPLSTVTVWIAVDPATTENGCLRVIPGTHEQGLMPHETNDSDGLALNQGVAKGAFDEREAVDIKLEAGQISLHHAMLVHGSNANHSAKRRCGYAIRYMPATSHFDRTLPPTRIANNQAIDFSQRPLWLVRGMDRANNDFSIGH
jgi:Phytanoyl-CoA dioxygenase (PhyH)